MAIGLEKIRNFPIFSGLKEKELQEIASSLIESHASAGKIISFQGEEARFVYTLAQGIVRIRRLSPMGREIVIHYLGPGRIIDPASAVSGNTYTITADALTNVIVYAMPLEDFRQMLEENKQLSLNLLKELADRVRRLTDMVEEMALHSVRTRLARFLLQQTEYNQHRAWTQAEIASQIGTVREIVGRILRDFASQGLIARQGGHIIILNREKLWEIAQVEKED